jgi:hypothetical protein
MSVTEIAGEVESQLRFLVQIAQETAVDAIERVAQRAQSVLPESATRLANSLPNAAKLVDRGFETTEQFLRSQRAFAAKLGDALTPQA